MPCAGVHTYACRYASFPPLPPDRSGEALKSTQSVSVQEMHFKKEMPWGRDPRVPHHMKQDITRNGPCHPGAVRLHSQQHVQGNTCVGVGANRSLNFVPPGLG